jgi:hypothetical protein
MPWFPGRVRPAPASALLDRGARDGLNFPIRTLVRQLKEFAGLAGGASHLWPRWIFLRAVGLIYVVVFAGVLSASLALIGPHGVYPVAGFFGRLQQAYPGSIQPFFLAPSVFWLSGSRGMLLAVGWLGLAASLAVVLNLGPRIALFVCWAAFLSFFSAWLVFSPAQLDFLMIEVALLAIPFAPPGWRPGLGAATPARPIALFALRCLLLRLMLESGIVKLVSTDSHWRNFTAMDVMYETAPFPTFLGYLDHQLPHAYHLVELALTFAAECAAPFIAIFGGRRGRWLAFALWTIFQLGIELTCNFGWLNLAAIGCGVLLLDDQMLRRPSASVPSRPIPGWSRVGLRIAVTGQLTVAIAAFGITLRSLRGLDPLPFPAAVAAPARVISAFYSANAYHLYATFRPEREGVEFAGSDDGGRTWHAYEYAYLAQRPDRIDPFFSPWFPRFDTSLDDPTPDKAPLYRDVAAQLLAGNGAVAGLFRGNPFPSHPPALIRLRDYRLWFTDWAAYRRTGRFWRKEYRGDYLPMLYRDESGKIASSNLAEGDAALKRGDVRTAAAIYERQYALGYPYAGYRLANLMVYGLGRPKDYPAAFAIYEELARRGEAEAWNDLGRCHEHGLGVLLDDAQAADCYRQAARQESLSGLYNLAMLAAKGRAGRRDDFETLTLLREAEQRAGGGDAASRGIRSSAAAQARAIEARLEPQAAARARLEATRRIREDEPLGRPSRRDPGPH